MKVKFVYDGHTPPDNDREKEISIEMKCLPHPGDRLRMADGSLLEILSLTHTPHQSDSVAVAAVKQVSGPDG